MKKKKRSSAQLMKTGDVALNITAMADIFTVLLVFLLMGYSTNALNIQPSPGVTLPAAGHAEGTDTSALKVEISRTVIQVESQPVTTLTDYRVSSADRQADGTLGTLREAFSRERQRQIALAGANSDVKLDSRIVLIADQDVPYETLKSVLSSAAVQGYTDFKLAIVEASH